MSKEYENQEDRPDLCKAYHMGSAAFNNQCLYVSASRLMMGTSQSQGKITIAEPDRKHQLPGMDEDAGKYVFDIKAPCDLMVRDIISRDYINNPETTIIYESENGSKLGRIVIPTNRTLHDKYGFKYITTPELMKLKKGDFVSEGTIFASSISVKNGGYDYGVNLNIAVLTMEETGEDGIVLSESAIKKLGYDTFETITCTVEHNQIAKNIYGDDDVYLSLPSIGDKVRKDGVLMVVSDLTTKHDTQEEFLSNFPVISSRKQLKKIKHGTDIVYQVKNGADSYIDNISVIGYVNSAGKRKNKKSISIEGTTDQLDSLAKEENDYRRKIYSNYITFKKERVGFDSDEVVPLTKDLDNFLVKCISLDTLYNKDGKIPKQYLKSPTSHLQIVNKRSVIPPYVVEIVVRKRCYPQLGGKLTDLFSAKGVITAILPDERMPVDKNGRRADIASAVEATINRSIVGRSSDMYINDALATLSDKIRSSLGLNKNETKRRINRVMSELFKNNRGLLNEILKDLHGLYNIINPEQANAFNQFLDNDEVMYEHLFDVINLDATVVLPVDVLSKLGTFDPKKFKRHGFNYIGNKGAIGIIAAIEASHYKPIREPVSFINRNGVKEYTKNPCRIAPIYYILLDKTADGYIVSNSVKLQATNFSASLSKVDKVQQPVNTNNVRVCGQDETIILASVMTDRQLAEFYSRHNDPATISNHVYEVLNSEKPLGSKSIINRKKVGLGSTSALNLANHVYGCFGAELYYKKEKF